MAEEKKPDPEKTAWTPAGSSPLMVEQLKTAAASVKSAVEMHYFGSGASPTASLDGLHLCQMVRDAGPSITLKVFDAEGDKEECQREGVLFFPATILKGRNGGGLRLLGAFTGWELRILSEAILLAAAAGTGLSARTAQMICSLQRPLALKVFVSPESEFCVRPALLALRMAALSGHISAEIVNSADFPVMSERYRVENTPRTVANDTVMFDGAPGEAQFMELVMGALVPQGGIYR